MSQDLPNLGFMQEKIQKGGFLKKPSQELIFFCFRFIMNPLKAWNAKRGGYIFGHLKSCTGSVRVYSRFEIQRWDSNINHSK